MLRGYRVFGRTLSDGVFNVLIESTSCDSFICIKSGAIIAIDKDVGEDLKKSYTKLADGYSLMGILRLFEGDSYLILITGVFSVGQLYGCDVCKVTNVQFIALDYESTEVPDTRIAELQRFLSAGIFYYAYSNDHQKVFNLANSAQKRRLGIDADYRFFWNRNLTFPFEKYNINIDDWLVKCMCGSVLVRKIYVGTKCANVAIISRLSSERVGTRFNVRGVNDDGNVANFVETEQLLTIDDVESSFVQIRGSVPLFWEQPGINVGSHKVKLRPLEFSMLALQRHFTRLKTAYGVVTTVNLLGSKEGERLLSNAFQTSLRTLSSDNKIVSFDYHYEMKRSKDSINHLMKYLHEAFEEDQFFQQKSGNILRLQKGVIRTNCLDCLDRTNNVQMLIGLKVLAMQLLLIGMDQIKSNSSLRFTEVITDLWRANGDQCSVIYAGTGALDGKSKLKDASRSIARTIQNNLMDSSKQESFDLLLLGSTFGNKVFDKASNLLPTRVIRDDFYFYECPNETEAFVAREKDMCDVERLSVFAGTWNVNGGKNMYNVAFRHEQSLDAWIFPTDLFAPEKLAYDIIAIGLEEIVDLNASNVMKASTRNQRVWRDGIRKAINEFSKRSQHNTANPYVVLACEQLVGVCLIIFIRSSLVGKVRELSSGEVKTGMGGATGNKGSVVVRMTVNATSLCFVCSHFAAGQNEVANRNDDFQTALRKIRFTSGRNISSHDVIFWLGDFNYRISLSGEEVKNAVRMRNFEHLVHFDQLSQQKLLGKVFVNFNEGQLNFAPTYKYDTFSDDYDTSEKCRAPAWTDRVLWYDSNNLTRLVHYGRSELKTSDHRPVFAIFELDTLKVVPEKCQEVISDVVCSMGPPDATILCSIGSGDKSFSTELFNIIFQKLDELSITVLLKKMDGDILHAILPSGVDALASLSMDQISLGNYRLNVHLKSADWAEKRTEKLTTLFKEEIDAQHDSGFGLPVQTQWDDVNLDDDEEDAEVADSNGRNI